MGLMEEDFCKLSRRDMQRMWRTLKAERGTHLLEGFKSSLYGQSPDRPLRYWMDEMEKRLIREIACRPSHWERIWTVVKRKLKWM